MAKGRKKPIAKTTKSCADKRGGRVFLDVCGPKSVRSIGGKEYMLLVKDDFSRFSVVYFMRSKSEVSKYFKQYLADHRFSGTPSPVETVRTDDAAEFKSGYFADLCRERGIRQEFSTANSPQFNGVAERGTAMIESTGKAALIQAKCMFSGMGIPLSDSLWAAQAYWACNALNFTATKANPKCKSPYEMWYGRTPPSPFPFLKPGFVKRKRTNKLEPQAVPCFYVGPSPNRPRDSMRVIFSSGTMIDSRDVTWARIPPLASVLCEQGGQEPTELQETESVEGETNPSDGESDGLRSDRQKSAGNEEDDDDEESIFPLVVDPAPTRKAAPVGRSATKASFQPIEVESPERANNSSIGVGGSDVDASPVSTSPGSNADGAMPSPVLGGREAHRLEWTAAGPSGTVEGRTRGDFRRLQAVQNAGLLPGEVGLVSAREDSAFRATQGELVGSVMFGAEEIGVETAEVAFLSETQYMKDFLNSIDVDGSSKGTYFSCLEEVLQSEVTCVRDDYVFATSESYPAIGHVSEVESPPLRFSDIKHLKLKELWHGATKTEFSGLVDLKAFAFGVKIPRGSNVVSARWIFTWKVDKAGCVIKPKARLVARGFSQVHTVDFMETYSPTPEALCVKTVVAVAVERDWELRQLDVKQAFIQADLDYDVYMKLPDGCGDKSGEIVKLNKAVYGLKQAGRQWSLRLTHVLVEKIGMEQCEADPCVFRLRIDGETTMILCVHVDDIIVAGEFEVCDALYASLLQEFQTTQGNISWYLGCAFEHDKAGGVLRMSQRAFIESVASRYGVNTVSGLPASQSADLGPRREGEPVCDKPVRAAVGSLIWVGGMTRPDIANAARAVARQAHNPAERHWRAVCKIISYLNGTKKLGLVFSKGGGLKLSVYVDADYADKANDWRSVSGVAVMLGGTSVIASSTTQHCVTLSTSEAEYVAMAHGAKTALFTRAVLDFLQPQLVGRIIDLFEDNQGAIAMAENPISGGRTKHIDVRYHFIRELVKHNVIAIKYTESSNQHADILTKAIGAEGFVRHRRFLMNLPG